jgi:hypothetical protein
VLVGPIRFALVLALNVGCGRVVLRGVRKDRKTAQLLVLAASVLDVLAALVLASNVGCRRVVPRGVREDMKAAQLLVLAARVLASNVGCRRVVPRGVQKDTKVGQLQAVHPYPGRREDAHPNGEEDGPGMVLRRLHETRVYILHINMCRPLGDKV